MEWTSGFSIAVQAEAIGLVGLAMKTDPVFILSSTRSGSTLLRVMLAGHPSLFAPPEMHLLGHETMQDREAGLGLCKSSKCEKHGKCDERPGLRRALMNLLHIDEQASQKMIDAMIERNQPTTEVYNQLAQFASPRRLVDKTPAYAARMNVLNRAERLFPAAHYVFLYRHPYAVMESILRNSTETTPERAETVWKSSNGNALKFLAKVDPARQVRVSYERLVTEPEPVMREICGSLQIEFHPAVLVPYDGNRMTDGTLVGIGDPNFHNHKTIDSSLANAASDFEPHQPLSDETRSIAAVLGYEISAMAALPA